MVYINAISSHNTLKTDIKELIPNPVVRRRMSNIVKYGVAVGMECIKEVGSENVDAIITATGLGCLADSEKFLKIIIENKIEKSITFGGKNSLIINLVAKSLNKKIFIFQHRKT